MTNFGLWYYGVNLETMRSGLVAFNKIMSTEYKLKPTEKIIWKYRKNMKMEFTKMIKLLVFTRLETIQSLKHFVKCIPNIIRKCPFVETINLSFYGVNAIALKGLNTLFSRALNQLVSLKNLDIVYFKNNLEVLNFDWLLKLFDVKGAGLERLKLDFYGKIFLSTENVYFIALCANQVKKEFFLNAPDTLSFMKNRSKYMLTSFINRNNVVEWIAQNQKIRQVATELKL